MTEPDALLSSFLAEELADLGIDPTLDPAALRDVLCAAIRDRGGEVTWEPDALGWRVILLDPVRETFLGRSLEAALGWCLRFLKAPEFGATDDLR